jgi:hypothetical protein
VTFNRPTGVKNFKIVGVPPGLTIQTSDDLPSDSPIYALVGRIASAWARLEHTLDYAIWELSGLDQHTGACLTAQMLGHRPRCEALIALCSRRKLPTDLVKQVGSLRGSLYDVSGPRNRAIHDPWVEITSWSSDGDTTQTGQFRSMDAKELKFGAHPAETESLTKTLVKIQNKTRDCESLCKAILAAFRALPETQK